MPHTTTKNRRTRSKIWPFGRCEPHRKDQFRPYGCTSQDVYHEHSLGAYPTEPVISQDLGGEEPTRHW